MASFETRFGKKMFAEWFEPDGTMMKVKNVGKFFPPESRTIAISRSFYVIAYESSGELGLSGALRWLEDTATNGWTARQLRKFIRLSLADQVVDAEPGIRDAGYQKIREAITFINGLDPETMDEETRAWLRTVLQPIVTFHEHL
jgi:hypothetical protein